MPAERVHAQGGFFLIEALVSILIFALGILGLVALGAAAVNAQSDAQYRTEAASMADAIAAEMSTNVVRLTTGTEAAKEAAMFASMGQFSHQATVGGYCSFSGTVASNTLVKSILDRAANLVPGSPGLPGADNTMQQVIVAPAGTFHRVEITLCWKTASDAAPRKHTLVTYIH